MPYYYVDTELGCGIRKANSPKEAEETESRSVGSRHKINVVRRATPDDVYWVRQMGGRLPSEMLNSPGTDHTTVQAVYAAEFSHPHGLGGCNETGPHYATECSMSLHVFLNWWLGLDTA